VQTKGEPWLLTLLCLGGFARTVIMRSVLSMWSSHADKFFNDPSRSGSACSFVISDKSLISRTFLMEFLLKCMDHCS
jgi:hypothetical protein